MRTGSSAKRNACSTTLPNTPAWRVFIIPTGTARRVIASARPSPRGDNRSLCSFKEPFIKMEDRGWFHLDARKFRVCGIEQKIMLTGDDRRGDLQDCARLGLQPPVAELRGMQVSERRLQTQFLLLNNAHTIWKHGGHTDVSARKVLSRHVHQILQDGQGDALGHINYGAPRRVPAAAGEPGSSPVQARITRSAYAENAAAHQDGHQEGIRKECYVRCGLRSVRRSRYPRWWPAGPWGYGSQTARAESTTSGWPSVHRRTRPPRER